MTQGHYPTPYPAPPSPQYPHPQYPQPQYPAAGYGYTAPPPLKHSGLGILSVVLAALSAVAVVVTLVVAAAMSANDPTLFDDDEGPATMALGAAVILEACLSLVGVGLGIGGLADKSRRKVFPAIGVVFNGLIILAVVALMVLGAASK
jgi:hypothetical protein